MLLRKDSIRLCGFDRNSNCRMAKRKNTTTCIPTFVLNVPDVVDVVLYCTSISPPSLLTFVSPIPCIALARVGDTHTCIHFEQNGGERSLPRNQHYLGRCFKEKSSCCRSSRHMQMGTALRGKIAKAWGCGYRWSRAETSEHCRYTRMRATVTAFKSPPS